MTGSGRPESSSAPDGFIRRERSSPFFDLIGPLLVRRCTDGPGELALVLDERHLNARGYAHGGVLSALADVALGSAASGAKNPPAHLTTISLTIDFARAARAGDTIIARVDVQRVGRRVAFANCYLEVDGRPIAHASGIFATAG